MRFTNAVEHLAVANSLRSKVLGSAAENQKPLASSDPLPQSERDAKIPSPRVLQLLQELVTFFNQHSKSPNPLSSITSGSAFHFYLDSNIALVSGRCVFYTDCPMALQHFQQAESRLHGALGMILASICVFLIHMIRFGSSDSIVLVRCEIQELTEETQRQEAS